MTGGPPRDAAALVQALELHQAELALQNQELASANDELRRSGAAVTAARDRYGALHDLAPVALVTIAEDGLIIDVNRAAEAALGAPRVHLIERRLALFVDQALRPGLPAALAGLFAAGRAQGLALRLCAEGAAPRDVTVDGVVLHDEGARRALLVLTDVTAQRQAEEARRVAAQHAEEAQRLQSLGTLAGGIAHDFNNLLMVILGGTDHALRSLGPTSPLATTLTEVGLAARQAGHLAHQMLAYAGRGTSVPQLLDVVGLIREISPLVHASAKEVPVVDELPRSLGAVRGDPSQLRQVVLNLVVNAAEASHGRPGGILLGGRDLVVTAAEIAAGALGGLAPGPVVLIEVRDHGVGMDAATVARIFEPYFSTKFVGRGLGLAVVQGIVRGHHGALTVESEVGVGTTFRVYLPSTGGAAAAAPPPTRARLAASTRRILIVDDDPMVQRTAVRLVHDLGYQVRTAADGLAAIELFQPGGEAIDLVLMDLTMPRLDGVASARAIAALCPRVPIVMMSGYGGVPAHAEGVFAGSLGKPFDSEAMARVLERLLAD